MRFPHQLDVHRGIVFVALQRIQFQKCRLGVVLHHVEIDVLLFVELGDIQTGHASLEVFIKVPLLV